MCVDALEMAATPHHPTTTTTTPQQDALWINLKVLARTPAHCRLNCQGDLFRLQPNTWWEAFRRTFQGARRGWCVARLDDLVAKATAHARDHPAVRGAMLQHLRAAGEGLRNLQITYEDDVTTQAALERVLDKVAAATGAPRAAPRATARATKKDDAI
jgi:hypothetical protein